MKLFSAKKLMAGLGIMVISLAACEKDEPESMNPSPQNNEMKVEMTDSPGDYAALNVEIEKVEVYLEDEGWITLQDEAQVVSVMELTNGKKITLGASNNLKAGTYTKVRLSFGDKNTVTFKGSVSSGTGSAYAGATVGLQWDGPKEVIVEIDQQLSVNGSANVLLDFQVAESIKRKLSGMVIDPAVTWAKNTSTGAKGKVEASAYAAVLLTQGDDTVSTYTDVNGEFLIQGIDPGTYDLVVIPSYEDVMKGMPDDYTISGVVIAEGEIKQMGTIDLKDGK